jgi:CRP/FNR family transcriptional regulator
MLATLSRRLRRFVGLIDDLALKDVSARLARHLLELAEVAGGDQIELETTKVVLASRLGTVAETLSRTLRKMQRKKLIVVDGRRITILDEDGLQDIADGVGS